MKRKAKNPNTEMLEGIACPNRQCKEPYKKFSITCSVEAEVTDRNVEIVSGAEWGDESLITCDSCGECGTVGAFKR